LEWLFEKLAAQLKKWPELVQLAEQQMQRLITRKGIAEIPSFDSIIEELIDQKHISVSPTKRELIIWA